MPFSRDVLHLSDPDPRTSLSAYLGKLPVTLFQGRDGRHPRTLIDSTNSALFSNHDLKLDGTDLVDIELDSPRPQ